MSAAAFCRLLLLLVVGGASLHIGRAAVPTCPSAAASNGTILIASDCVWGHANTDADIADIMGAVGKGVLATVWLPGSDAGIPATHTGEASTLLQPFWLQPPMLFRAAQHRAPHA